RNRASSGKSADTERYATLLPSVDTLSHLAEVGQQPDHGFAAAPGRDVAGIACAVPEEQGAYSWGAQPCLGLRDVARGCAIAAESHVPGRYKRCIEADKETEKSDHRTGAEIPEQSSAAVSRDCFAVLAPGPPNQRVPGSAMG